MKHESEANNQQRESALPSAPLFCILLGLSAGNYAYQLLYNHEWETAAERSLFQLAVVVVIVIYRRIRPNNQAHRSAPGGEVERKGNDGKTN